MPSALTRTPGTRTPGALSGSNRTTVKGTSALWSPGRRLRTIVVKDRTAYVQSGAGLVADSDPELEYRECMNKAGALLRAIEMAERGLE